MNNFYFKATVATPKFITEMNQRIDAGLTELTFKFWAKSREEALRKAASLKGEVKRLTIVRKAA